MTRPVTEAITRRPGVRTVARMETLEASATGRGAFEVAGTIASRHRQAQRDRGDRGGVPARTQTCSASGAQALGASVRTA